MSLESEIDSENQARFQQMSSEEVTEAKADIMEKISTAGKGEGEVEETRQF
jgi:hypothetical protein